MDEVIAEQAHPGADPARRGKPTEHPAGLDRRPLRVDANACCDRPRASSSTENARQMIEPVFGHTKHNRTINRFHRRGRAAVRSEWRLVMATHNLIKLVCHER